MKNVNARQQYLVHQIQQPQQVFLPQHSANYNNINNNSQNLSQPFMVSEQYYPGQSSSSTQSPRILIEQRMQDHYGNNMKRNYGINQK